MTKQLLWLDDYRNPLEKDWLRFSPIGYNVDVHWVKTYQEFTDWVMIYGLPDAVCFDHDLHYEHMKWYFDNGGNENPPNPIDAKFVNRTGYDCAVWLCKYCDINKLDLPLYNIQSHNKWGTKNIDEYLKNWLNQNKKI